MDHSGASQHIRFSRSFVICPKSKLLLIPEELKTKGNLIDSAAIVTSSIPAKLSSNMKTRIQGRRPEPDWAEKVRN